MQLTHVPLANLSISALNMRHAKRAPNISDILPSVRKRGVLIPLLVRPNSVPDTFEIVAGRRRFFAARTVADEQGEIGPLPCHILTEGDDADAVEASMIENLLRQDPDPMTQYETFVKLIKAGKTEDDIAATFNLSARQVKQRLALGNLLPKIRDAYRREDLDDDTASYLTMATKSQQRDWLALFENEPASAPSGHQVKQWLFGGQSIPTSVAIFPLDTYPGHIVADLFGENSYFQDADLFWQKQNEAIAARRDAYLAAGWTDVVLLDKGQTFESWKHEKARKKDGGKVFIALSHRGEVTVHEGYISRKEGRRKSSASNSDEATKETAHAPEVTAAMQTYIDLHRHVAVRAALLDKPGVALRLAVAHILGGSRLWKVMAEPQRSGRAATDASVADSPAQRAFLERKVECLKLLGIAESASLVGYHSEETAVLFARLLALSDADVRRVLTVAMAESLEAGSTLVEAAGVHLGVDMAKVWSADDAFFDLLRDKSVISAMVAEIAGKAVANVNISATGKAQKQIIRDCLSGTNGRAKATSWLPRWLEFPVRGYRKDGALRTLGLWAPLKKLFAAS